VNVPADPPSPLTAEGIAFAEALLTSPFGEDRFNVTVPRSLLRSLLDAARAPDAGLRAALEQALDRFDKIGEHLKPDATDDDREMVAIQWWFGSEEVRAALASSPAPDTRHSISGFRDLIDASSPARAGLDERERIKEREYARGWNDGLAAKEKP